jgi:hypothetical protein
VVELQNHKSPVQISANLCGDNTCWCWVEDRARRAAGAQPYAGVHPFPEPRVPELELWCVYDHPKDEPEHFIARKWLMVRGQMIPTRETITHQNLDALRGFLQHTGLSRFERMAADDASILETWL